MQSIKNIKPYNKFYLKVSDIHSIYVEQAGKKDGKDVLFLHGGPGGCINEKIYDFFDLSYYNVTAFDQRGCGKSKPFASLEENTIWHLADDIEKLRKHLKIEKWIIFGGSFGSTLALFYSIKYPDNVEKLVLRGIFLGRNQDIRWLYQEGASYFYPEKFEEYVKDLNNEERKDIVSAFYKRLTSDDKEVMKNAAKAWANWEGGLLKLVPDSRENDITDHDISLSRLECHYFYNHMFWEDDNYIIENIDKIKDIKTYIVHGRYDIDCRVEGAYTLSKKLNDCILYITDSSGHSPYETNNFNKLREIMDDIKK